MAMTPENVSTMQLIPAIDLKDGQCVRLRQGRMEDNTVFSDDPVATARRWMDAGSQRLHLVDLDGAFAGEPRNADVIRAICREFPQLPVQIGGGIRDEQTVEAYFAAGIQWAIIGTQAVREPSFVSRLCAAWPDRIIVGLDARDGRVALNGWAEDSAIDATELACQFEGVGVSAIVYTDIARDGMMQGYNRASTSKLAQAVKIPVIASGGVSSYADIDHLCDVASHGVSGAILGRALYDGTIDFHTAQERVQRRLRGN